LASDCLASDDPEHERVSLRHMIGKIAHAATKAELVARLQG